MSQNGTWSIGDVAANVGLDVDTLRYYERRGALPRPDHDAGGRRRYHDAGVNLIEVLLRLLGTGMLLSQFAEFTRLVALDPGGVRERLSLLVAHRDGVRQQIEAWNASLTVIYGKIRDYSGRMAVDEQTTAAGPDAGLTAPPPAS